MKEPLFASAWWLDAVAPGEWDEVIIERDGQVIGRLPFTISRTYGLTQLGMPPLTQTLGPWVEPLEGKYASRLSKEKKLMTELIEMLPRFDIFYQKFHHTVTNWLPFYWKGFEQTTRYTYRLENLRDIDAIFEDMRSNIRSDIRKAENELAVRTDLGLDAFMRLNKMTFQRQDIEIPYNQDLVARLDEACSERACRRMFFAEDGQGRLHAAVYIVWDEDCAYYLMSGADPALRNSGATSLLLWEAIRFAATLTQAFDFEGSMMESVERFFRAFGARQIPYFQVAKVNSLALTLARDVKSWRRKRLH